MYRTTGNHIHNETTNAWSPLQQHHSSTASISRNSLPRRQRAGSKAARWKSRGGVCAPWHCCLQWSVGAVSQEPPLLLSGLFLSCLSLALNSSVGTHTARSPPQGHSLTCFRVMLNPKSEFAHCYLDHSFWYQTNGTTHNNGATRIRKGQVTPCSCLITRKQCKRGQEAAGLKRLRRKAKAAVLCVAALC